MKGRVYIETSIVSYLTGRFSNDAIVAAHQKLTREWWDERSHLFELMVSELVIQEAAAGDPEIAGLRLNVLANLKILTITEEAADLAKLLTLHGPIPPEFAADAMHIAITAANQVEFSAYMEL